MSVVTDRDGNRCVRCGKPHTAGPFSEHHRIHGNRSDNRPSNKLLLCGTGITGCHGEVASDRKRNAWGGYVVSRHVDPAMTLQVPVYYYQPALGRVGYYLLDDDGGLTAWAEAGPSPEQVAELERSIGFDQQADERLSGGGGLRRRRRR